MKYAKQILVLILGLVFNISSFRAQFICTDVSPDITNTGNATQDIDLNNDLIPDFRLTSAQIGTLSFVIVQGSQIGTNNFVLSDGGGNALALPSGSVIGSGSSTWTQMSGANLFMVLITNTTATGTWLGAADQYLGLKLIVGASTYYGWARFSFSLNSNTYTFKDYAYNSLSSQQILAGQGCGSIAFPLFSISSNVCVGSTTSLVANTGNVIPNVYAWASSPAGALFTAASSSATSVTFSAAGVYTILLVTSSGATIGIAQNTVTVGFTPTLSSNSPVCAGQPLFLSANGGTAYAWNGPQGFSSAIQNPSLNVSSLTNNGTYSLLVTSVAGCTITASTVVTINPLPTFFISPSFTNICSNNSTVVLSAGGNASTFSWSPATNLSSTSGATVVASPTVTTVYTATGSLNGCSSVATATAVVQAVAIFNISLTDYSMCAQAHNVSPNTVTLNITGPNNSYNIAPLSSPFFTSTNISSLTIVLSPLAPYQSYSVTGVFTLTLANPVCKILIPVSLQIIPNPTLTCVSSNSAICLGKSATINASGASACFWNASTPGLNSYTIPTVLASPTVSTVYAVYGSSASCNSLSQNSTIVVNPNPTVTVSGTLTCINQPAIVTAGGALTYFWIGPGTFTSSSATNTFAANPSISLTGYTISGTDVNSCTGNSTTSLTVVECLGLNTISEKSDFRIYPNPTENRIFIERDLAMEADIEISDINGKVLLKENRKFQTSQENLDLSAFRSGLYFMKISTTNNVCRIIKVIKN